MVASKGKWFLKSCPSCGGDLYADLYDPRDMKCLQCGRSFYSRSAKEQLALRREVEQGRKVRLPA